MKILLVQPASDEVLYSRVFGVNFPPVGLGYLSGFLGHKGHKIRVIDMPALNLRLDQFQHLVRNEKPDAVGIYCAITRINQAMSVARISKNEGAFTVLGGPEPSINDKTILLENSCVDAVVRGEGEITFLDLIGRLEDSENLDEVKGVTYRNGRRIVANPSRPLIENLDELPFPARHIVKSKHYRQGTFVAKHCTTMVTSRGCPYHCTYCLWPGTLYGHHFRARSSLNVVEEIEQVVRDYHIDEIYFDEDCLALDRKRILEICRLIKERQLKVKWISQCRVDSMDEEVVQSIKQAGCRYIRFGVESGSQRMLQTMKKGVTLGKIRKAFELCRGVGIKTQAFFLFGIPGETEDSIREPIKFAKELRADSAQFAVVIPHPGTELYRICQDNGWLKYNSWEDFSAGNCLIETKHLSRRDIERARIQAYREFYFRPSYILATALKLRGLTDIKSVIKSAVSIIDRIGYFKERAGC